jgi:hypothetical protein
MAKGLYTQFQARLVKRIRADDPVTLDKLSKKAGFNLSPSPPEVSTISVAAFHNFIRQHIEAERVRIVLSAPSTPMGAK